MKFISINFFLYTIQKYSLLLVLLYCVGALTPDLYVKNSLLSYDLDMIISSQSGSNHFKQIFWSSLFLFLSCSFMLGKEDSHSWNSVIKTIFYLLIICLTTLVSTMWSNYPSLTVKRGLFQVIFVITLVLSVHYSEKHNYLEKNIEFFLYALYFMTSISILSGYGFADNGTLASFSNNKNNFALSLICVTIIVFALKNASIININNYRFHITLLLLMLILTQSKTNLSILVAFYFLSKMGKNHIALVLSGIYLSSILVFVISSGTSSLLGNQFNLLNYVDEDFLTGRGFIWDTLYYDLVYFDKFMLGYGYGAYFGTPDIPYFFDDEYSFIRFITSAHNGYIEHYVQFGFFVSIFLFLVYFLCSKTINNKYLLLIMIIPILHNITETSMLKDNSIAWFTFIFSFAASNILKPKSETMESQQIELKNSNKEIL